MLITHIFFFLKHSSKYISIKCICVITWWMSASNMDSIPPTSTLSDTLKGVRKYLPKGESFPKPGSHTHPRTYTLTSKVCVFSFPSYILGFSIVFLLLGLACLLASWNRCMFWQKLLVQKSWEIFVFRSSLLPFAPTSNLSAILFSAFSLWVMAITLPGTFGSGSGQPTWQLGRRFILDQV